MIKLKNVGTSAFTRGFHAEIFANDILCGAIEFDGETKSCEYVWLSPKHELAANCEVDAMSEFKVNGKMRKLKRDELMVVLAERHFLLQEVARYRKTRTYFQLRGGDVNSYAFMEREYTPEVRREMRAHPRIAIIFNEMI